MTKKISERVPDGIHFYVDPEDLKDHYPDPLLRTAVKGINQSGWVWTAESCQGHIDCDELYVGWGLMPYVRLVCEIEHRGRLLDRLAEASHFEDGVSQSIELMIVDLSQDDWAQLLVRTATHTTYDRNQGCLMFERLAHLVNK